MLRSDAPTQVTYINVLTMKTILATALGLLATSHSVLGKLTWGTTDYMFVFGDSYTTDGYNISAGIDSPVPGYVRNRPLLHSTSINRSPSTGYPDFI